MKKMRSVLSLVVVSAALGAGHSVFAQNFPRPATRPTQSELQWKNGFRAYESDQRALAELMSARETQAERQIAALAPAKFDRDGNGRFNETEFNAWLGAVRSAIVATPEVLARFDTNRNGQLDGEEWSVVIEKLTGKA